LASLIKFHRTLGQSSLKPIQPGLSHQGEEDPYLCASLKSCRAISGLNLEPSWRMAAGQAHATSSSSHGDQWDALQCLRDALQEISGDWYAAIPNHCSLMHRSSICALNDSLWEYLVYQCLGMTSLSWDIVGVSSIFSPAQGTCSGFNFL